MRAKYIKDETLRDAEKNGKEKDTKNLLTGVYILNIKPKFGDPLAADMFY